MRLPLTRGSPLALLLVFAVAACGSSRGPGNSGGASATSTATARTGVGAVVAKIEDHPAGVALGEKLASTLITAN